MIKHIVDKIADRTRWGYLLAFIILLISYIVSYISTQNLMKQSQLVNHSNQIIHGLDNIVSYVTQCESATRGYIITDKKELLNKCNSSRRNADSALQSLKTLTLDNPEQQKNIDSLSALITDKLTWLQNVVSIFDSTHTITENILNTRDIGIYKMNKVENFVQFMQNDERKIWHQRNNQQKKYSYVIKTFTIFSLLVAIMLTLYSIITFNKENKAKQQADKKANAYRQQLEMRVDELAALNTELIELRNIEKFAVTGRISRTIAHEVRNPLTNINLAAEQLKNEIPVNNDVALLFEMIARNSNRINQLISDLLNATRITDLNFEKVCINDVIDKSLEFAKDRIELKNITIQKHYNEAIKPLMLNQEKIIIAFLNLIVNSLEAMDEKGILTITSTTSNNRCIVKFSDNGKGILKEDLGRLFEPYFTTKEKGTGLGLTNTQNIILAHNGSIQVESEPGKGSAFTVVFNVT